MRRSHHPYSPVRTETFHRPPTAAPSPPKAVSPLSRAADVGTVTTERGAQRARQCPVPNRSDAAAASFGGAAACRWLDPRCDVLHGALSGAVTFLAFPPATAPPTAALPGALGTGSYCDGADAALPAPGGANFASIGQLSYKATPAQVGWVIATVTGTRPHDVIVIGDAHFSNGARVGGGNAMVQYGDEARHFKAFHAALHQRLLWDVHGVWYAADAQQFLALAAYCARGEAECRVLQARDGRGRRFALPRRRVTVEVSRSWGVRSL